MVIATSGDPMIRMHKNVAEGAREAVSSLPTVSAEGLRRGHAELLEGAIAETRKSLEELARAADVGAAGAGALGEQDSESGRRYERWDGPELQVKGAPVEIRVI